MANHLLSPEQRELIEKKVNDLLVRYVAEDYNQSLALGKIVQEQGIKLEESHLNDISGVLFKDEKDGWRLVVNQDDSPTRKLFTVAHELGHYFLHKEDTSKFIDGQFVSSYWKRTEEDKFALKEIEANEFAGSLIMPKFIIEEMCGDNKNKIDNEKVKKLAQKFGVSLLAMITRLRNLGYDI